MIPPWVSFLFVLVVEYFSARRDAQFRFMKLQMELVTKHLPGNRVPFHRAHCAGRSAGTATLFWRLRLCR